MQNEKFKVKAERQQGNPNVAGNYGDKGSLKALLMCWVRQPFGYFKIATTILAFVLILLSIAHIMSPKPSRIYAEGGPIEWLSFGFWIAAMLICCLALSRQCKQIDRQIFWWICLICFLAAARELDAQVLLNPKYLGQFGVHYKTRWFLSPEVNIFLKLFWFSLFLMLGGNIIFPLIAQRKLIIQQIRNGDVAAGFFLLGVIGLTIGFIFDDILRKTTFLDRDLRQSMEETAEMLGAAFFLIGTGLFLWKPFSERTEVMTVSTDNENSAAESNADFKNSPATLNSLETK